MTASTRYLLSIRLTEDLLEATFPDDLGMLGRACAERVGALQKEFKNIAGIAHYRLNSLHIELGEWRGQVSRGEKEFDPEQDTAYREALSALASFIDRLYEKSETFRQKAIYLARPRFITNLLGKKAKIEKTLATWKSPAPPAAGRAGSDVVVAHTGTPRDAASLSGALDRISRPAARESVPLGCDPDDYPAS